MDEKCRVGRIQGEVHTFPCQSSSKHHHATGTDSENRHRGVGESERGPELGPEADPKLNLNLSLSWSRLRLACR